MKTRIGPVILVMALVAAIGLVAPRGAAPQGLVSASPLATPTPRYKMHLPLALKNYYQIGSGWIHFGQYGGPPMGFNWSSSGVVTQTCFGSTPPAGLLWQHQNFVVFPLTNGTWFVYLENTGPFPWATSPNLVAWRCSDGQRVVLAPNITDQGASLFSKYGETRLVVGRWDELPTPAHPSLVGQVQAFGGDAVTFAYNVLTTSKVDDVKQNIYGAMYEVGGPGGGRCYERGTISPPVKTWEKCFGWPALALQKVAQEERSLPLNAADGGGQFVEVSFSGRYVFMNWIPIPPTGQQSAWACSIWDTQSGVEVERINFTYDATNPCYGEVDWRLTTAGHEEFWYQAYWAPLTGLNIYDATSRVWVTRNQAVTGLGMSLSDDRTRFYTTSGPGAIVIAHDMTVLTRTWTVTLTNINASDVLPAH